MSGLARRFRLTLTVLCLACATIASAQAPGQESEPETPILDGLDPLTRHRAFPYVDKAVRAERAGDHAQAVAHWRNALDRAPGHVPLVRSLYEALLRAERFNEALELLARYPDAAPLDVLRRQVRVAWLSHDRPPERELWLRWVAGADGEHAVELVETWAFSTLERGGPDGALAGLAEVPCPGPACARALRLRAAIAEQAGRPAEVAAALEMLARWDRWNDEDERRAVLAWLALDDFETLAAHLGAEVGDTDPGLIEQAAQRAIGRQQWNYAKIFLERLRELGRIDGDALAQLTEVYRELGELEQAASNAHEQGQCLRAVELARQAARPDTARQWLAECAADPAGDWLELAVSLEAADLLMGREFGQPELEARRLEAISTLLERQHRDAELIEVLAGRTEPRARELLAAALVREQRHVEAADIWAERYRAAGELDPLERATYLYRLAGRDDRAAALLVEAAPFPDSEQGGALSYRLLGLYPLPELDPEGRVLAQVAGGTDSRELRLAAAGTMHRIGLCETLLSLELDTRDDPGGAANMLLGFCLQRRAPGLAVHHFRAAHERGAGAALRPLAVTLTEVGQPEAALPYWLELEQRDGLSDEERAMLVETALQAGDHALAAGQWRRLPETDEPEWWSMRARIARAGGDLEQALAAWQEVHSRRPGGESAFQIGVLRQALDDREGAIEALGEAVEFEPDQPQYVAEYAYALEPRDPERAAPLFERAIELEPWRYDLHEQLGYTQARVFRERAARDAFGNAIDRLEPAMPPPELDRDDTIRRRYAARRMHESLGREWSVQASAWASTGSVPGEFFFDRDPPRNYAQLLVQRRIGQRGPFGSLHARGRLLGDGSADSPLARNAATLGLIWQLPVGISVVGLDWIISDERPDQLLVHGSTELLATGRFRRDWRPAESRWQEQRLFLEGAWWTESDDFLISARYDRLVHFAFDRWNGASWFPYVAGEGRLVQDGHDVRVAVGVGLRKWTGQSRYDAWKRLHQLRVEFQQTIETDIADDNGVFVRFESEW